jgi:hypothetical protein
LGRTRGACARCIIRTMGSGRAIAVAVLAMAAGRDPVLAQTDPGAEKTALINTLQAIQDAAQRLEETHRDESQVAPVADRMFRAARWLSNAANQWTPVEPGESWALRASLGRILLALRTAPAGGARLELLVQDLEADLSLKALHCQEKGLAVPQRVTVVTKQDAKQEVKGLEVWYIEKFLESDGEAKPYQFRGFSSPAVEDMVPGRYVFWASEPGGQHRSGTRKVARVFSSMPREPIEVLAP